jgi:phosphatidylserine decarboxylase
LSVVFWCFVICVVVIGSMVLFVDQEIVRYAVIATMLVFFALVLNFFRDPERVTPSGDGLVISPADGKVVVIKERFEGEFLQADAVQVSIFMSPLNVHVNRWPVSGTVGYFKHIPGEYLVAFDDKSSDRNERTHIGVDAGGMKVFFKQIAGTVARRIVADLSVGMPAVAGERFGMIRFGSRVDVLMPKGVAVKVRLGEHVSAGQTVLAEFRPGGTSNEGQGS